MSLPESRFVIVTGTDTGVGKTIATAALVLAYEAAGKSVAVVKPVQTGIATGEPTDIEVIRRLTGLTAVQELVRLDSPLSPTAAARLQKVELPPMEQHLPPILALDTDVVLIEGAGGLLVPLDGIGRTLIDFALELDAAFVIVGREGLGTLNHFALTVEHLRDQGHGAHIVLGSCSPEPDLAAVANLFDLPRVTGLRIDGSLPAGAGRLSREDFRTQAPSWFRFVD